MDASVKFNEVIESVANNYLIVFIDNNAAISKDTQNFADNVHYTDEGAKLVASSFANYLKNRKVD